jgi:hypothetical protein
MATMPCARATRGELSYGLAVERDFTAVGRHGACENLDECGLAGAILSDGRYVPRRLNSNEAFLRSMNARV